MMLRFVIVSVLIVGLGTLVVLETGSLWTGLILVGMMVIQWDQAKRVRALALVLKKVYVDAKYGRRGVSL